MIQAFLICEDPNFCEYLKERLRDFKDFVVCGEAAPDTSATGHIIRTKPHLVIVETSNADNFKFVDELISAVPGQRVFWIWQQLNSETEKRALSHHIAAVFAKDEDLKVLVRNARALLD
ncbi:MAG TPA: hypothetical protein VGF20_10735 [Candidatus Acidoferrum sp.]|jgi:DNA-binding NarL/FixJ family response regulator